MDNFKYIVDILSSLASFVAIATVLISWFNSSKKALKIEGIVAHLKKEEAIFILLIKNRKSYPVTIKSINAYLKPKFLVEKLRNLPPMYTSKMSAIDLVYMSSENLKFLPTVILT